MALVDMNHPTRTDPAILLGLFFFAVACLYGLRRMALAAYQG